MKEGAAVTVRQHHLTVDYPEGDTSRVITLAAADLLDKLEALNMHFLQIETPCGLMSDSPLAPRSQETNWLAIKMEESKRN